MRFEIFPGDLDATVDFYTRVLRFRLITDQRGEPSAHVALQRGSVRVGAATRVVPDARAARLPPAGVELVLEVDDVVAERDRIIAAGWPLVEDLRDRPWGLYFRAVIEVDDGAVIMVELHGYGRTYPPERRQIVGSVFHQADREPYRRLNDAVCVCVGEVRASSDPAQTGPDLVIDVAELIWEPIAD